MTHTTLAGNQAFAGTKRLRRPRRGVLVAGLVWAAGVAAGVAAIAWLTPVGPRAGWQPPADQFAIHLLTDGRTLVTVPHTPNGDRTGQTPVTGPVRLWDIETGQLRASHFSTNDIFGRVMVLQDKDLLKIIRPAGETEEERHTFLLQLHDAWTGECLTSFTCRIADGRRNGTRVWWIFSRDVHTTAFVTDGNGGPQVEWYDVASGRLLQTLSGWHAPICFSPDGRRFAATQASGIGVFEVPTGRKIAHLKLAVPRRYPPWPFPNEFSPDGGLLLDSTGKVWDVDTAQLRFQVPAINLNSFMFSPDGQAVVAVDGSTSAGWLAYYRVTTGQEQVERRVPLVTGTHSEGSINRETQDGRLLLAASDWMRTPTQVETWLAKLPGLQVLGKNQVFHSFAIVETATGREIGRGNLAARGCTPDGRYVFTEDAGVLRIWDVPPRTPMRWLLPLVVGWSATLGFIIRRLNRRRASTNGGAGTRAKSPAAIGAG